MATGMESFGRGMTGQFVGELNRVQQANLGSARYDLISSDALMENATMLGALKTVGGMTAQGAIATNQLADRAGRGASSLNRPEDIVAFQKMREKYPDKSITELMMYMEANPQEVAMTVAQHIEADSSNQDIALLRMKSYLGGNTTQANAYIKAATSGLDSLTDAEADIINKEAAEIAVVGMDKTAVDQMEMFAGIQKTAYEVSQGFLRALRGEMPGISDIEFGETLSQGAVNANKRDVLAKNVTADMLVVTNAVLPQAGGSADWTAQASGYANEILKASGTSGRLREFYSEAGQNSPEDVLMSLFGSIPMGSGARNSKDNIQQQVYDMMLSEGVDIWEKQGKGYYSEGGVTDTERADMLNVLNMMLTALQAINNNTEFVVVDE